MKNANELTAPIMAGKLPATGGGEPPRIDSGSAQVVNALFRELQACFPAWRQAWPTDEAMATAKKTWIKGFAAAGINTLEQIRYGIEQCRLMPSDFMPSVGRFIELCKPTPEMLGLPTADKAFDEACRKAHPAMQGSKWSHQAVYHAAAESGFYNLTRLPQDAARKLFDRNYAVACRMVMDGEPLKTIPLGLPDPYSVSSVRTEEGGRRGLEGLRAALRGGTANA